MTLKYYIILLGPFIALSALQSVQRPDGKRLYEANCRRCHGADGNKGFLGAGKLMQSRLDDAAAIRIIQKGKRIMPSFRKTLSDNEIKSLVSYIKTLRKTK